MMPGSDLCTSSGWCPECSGIGFVDVDQTEPCPVCRGDQRCPDCTGTGTAAA